jgi:hypothetical protein
MALARNWLGTINYVFPTIHDLSQYGFYQAAKDLNEDATNFEIAMDHFCSTVQQEAIHLWGNSNGSCGPI